LVCHDCHILLHEGGYRVVRQPGGGWALAPPEHASWGHPTTG
jgi:hypothetical protein